MSTGNRDDAAPRKRDAAASRKALLDAARELFGERGYDRTTLRDIGERAGVDAALVARYYGNKAGIYLAAVTEEGQDTMAARRDIARIGALLDHFVARMDDRGGPGPLIRAMLGLDTDPAVKAEASSQLIASIVEPIAESVRESGAVGDTAEARRRAELAVAAVIGAAVVRPTGVFPELAAMPREDVVELLGAALRPMLGEASEQ